MKSIDKEYSAWIKSFYLRRGPRGAFRAGALFRENKAIVYGKRVHCNNTEEKI